jgi:hypothetical protein
MFYDSSNSSHAAEMTSGVSIIFTVFLAFNRIAMKVM